MATVPTLAGIFTELSWIHAVMLLALIGLIVFLVMYRRRQM